MGIKINDSRDYFVSEQPERVLSSLSKKTDLHIIFSLVSTKWSHDVHIFYIVAGTGYTSCQKVGVGISTHVLHFHAAEHDNVLYQHAIGHGLTT